MAKIIKQEKISKLDIKNINDASSREITRKFGKAEDFIEVHIYDLNGKLLQSINSFTDYTLPPSSLEDSLVSEINIDFQSVLKSLGYRSGAYKVQVNIQRRKIFTQRKKSFSIQEISPSRTELRLETFRSNLELSANAREFINLLKGSPLFRDFNLNFGKNINLLGVNLDIDTSNPDKYALLVKTLKPLPSNIVKGDKLNITEEIIESIVTTYDLGIPTLIEPAVELSGPNFKIDVRLNDTIPTALKSYDDILRTDTTSSYQKLLSKLSGYEVPEIDYNYIRPIESSSIEAGENAPSHFENFVHFGSAIERLKNFEYKLNLLELYDTQMVNIRTIEGSTSQSSVVLTATASIGNKKDKLIQDFDGYERFLYFESGAYSWPKTNTTEPYTQAHTTSSDALIWLGSEVSVNQYYGGQLNSASIYDIQNHNNLINTIPNHIGDKDENAPYLLFCNMMGNMFDPIWAHIKEITQIRNNSHIYGVSKDLVYFTLKSLGIEALDQFENQDLVNYILESKTTTIGELKTTVITGSNVLPPKGDITKEIWKRLYHNAPYLLKTKGTARGIQALINCYGIPDTVLNVKEYMGSAPNREDYNTFTQNKYLKILDANSVNSQGFFIESQWSSSAAAALSASAKTIEFRAKPYRSDLQQHLLTLSSSISSSDMHLQLHPYTGSNDFYVENDRTQYGKLVLNQFTSSIAESSGVGQIISPTELTDNGAFVERLGVELATTAGATEGTGATINAVDKVTFVADGGVDYVDPIVVSGLMISGKQYIASATISGFAGSSTIGFSSQGGPSSATGESRIGSDGTINHNFISNGNAIRIFAGDGVAGVMDNISLREVNSEWIVTKSEDAVSLIKDGAFVSTNPGSTQGFTSAAQAQTLIAGNTYRLTFDVTAVTGNVGIYNYSDSQQYSIGTATVGTFTHEFTSDGTGGIDVRSIVAAGESVTIDNISLKEVLIPEGYFPIYNGEFWDLYLNTDGASGSDATVGFGAYQANHLKEINYFTQSISISERTNSEVFGNPYYGGLTENNKITNGDFADTSAWFMHPGGTSTITGGKLVFANAQQFHYVRQVGLSIGRNKTYRLTFTVSDLTEGSVSAVLVTTEGESTTRTARTTNGTYTEDITMPGAGSSVTGGQHNSLWFSPSTVGSDTNSFKIDDVSLVEINDKRETGSDILYLGGIRTGSSTYTTAVTGSSFDLEYSGSINEFRLYFGEKLSHDTLSKHALEPFMYAGNSPTSSYNTLVARYPLSFELEDEVGNNESFIPSGSLTDNVGVSGTSPNEIVNYATNAWNTNPTASADQSQDLLDSNAPITGGAILSNQAITIISNQPGYPDHEPIFVIAGTPLLQSHHPKQDSNYLQAFTYLKDKDLNNHEETHHLITPNSVGRLISNNKIKIDSGSVEDGLLSTNILSQTPTLNRQAVDYDEVGVFFSPQNELNEDIIYTMGHFSVDNTLGDPRHQTSSYYPDLQALKDHYFQKLTAGSHRLNVFDFTRLVQFTDHTLFEMIKKFVPQKANLKTGLLIEPHYLERVKFERNHPIKKQILLDSELVEVTQSFSKNNNISQLDFTSGSVVVTHTSTNYPDSYDGIELVLNPDFSVDTHWNKNANWTVGSSGVATSDGSSNANINRPLLSRHDGSIVSSPSSNPTEEGIHYRVTFEIKTLTSGTGYYVRIGQGNNTSENNDSPTFTTVGVHTAFITSEGPYPIHLYVSPVGNAAGTIDNISVKELGKWKTKGIQQDYNTVLDVDKYFSGSSDWEHGPIVPKSLQIPTWKSPELTTNGRFESDIKWTKGGGWTITGGKAVASGDSGNLSQPQTNFEFNRTYRVTFTISDWTKGNLRVVLYSDGMHSIGTTRAANGTFTEDLTINQAGGSFTNTILLQTISSADEDFKVDNVSIREVGVNTKTRYSDTFRTEDYNGPISLHPSSSFIASAFIPNTKSPYGVFEKSKLSKNFFLTPGNLGSNYGLLTGSNNLIQNGDFNNGTVGWTSDNVAVGNGVANFNGSAGNYPFIQQSGVRRGGFGDKYEITFTVTDWNNGTIGGSYTTLRLNMGAYPNGGVPSDIDNTSDTSFASTRFPLLVDSNTVQLNTPIKKTFISDGNNHIQIYVGNYDGDISITNVELRKIEDRQSVRFNDSILDTKGWKNPRYDGSKLIGAEINKYTKGDITYGKNPVLNKKSTSIYFGTSVIGADGIEDSSLVKIKNHSYVNIDTIISIDSETDNVEIINTSATPYDSYQRLLANDLSQDKNFSLKILDKNVENKKKNNYKSKFSQGLLYKTVEHKGKDGTGNIYGEGIQAGQIFSASYQNGPTTRHKTPNLIENPHFYSFGPEILIDGNFTGSYIDGEANSYWEGPDLTINSDGEGIAVQSLIGSSGQFSGFKTIQPVELEDGKMYRLECVSSNVNNDGDTSGITQITLGDASRGGNAAYRPMTSTNTIFNGKQIFDFKFDKSQNNNVNFMRIYIQFTNGHQYDKSARFKNISLKKITPNTSGYTISHSAGTAWTIVNGRAIAGLDTDFGYLNISTNGIPMKNGSTYEFELDVVGQTTAASGLKLANNLAGGGGNLEIQKVNGTYTGHQRVRWVHSDGNEVGNASLNRIRLYNATNFNGYVTNLRLYEVEPYETNGNVFCYGKHTNTMNDSTLEIFKNDLTREIWNTDETFGFIDAITSSANKVTDSIDNLARFYDSRLLPFASESQKRLFVTFQDGQPIRARKGIDIPSNTGIKTISTAELDLESYNYFPLNETVTHKAGGTSTTVLDYTSSLFMTSHSYHNVVSGGYHSTASLFHYYDNSFYAGTNRPITQPYYFVIPLKKEAHDIPKDYKQRRGGNTGNWKGVAQNIFGQAVKLNYTYSGNATQKAQYQLSYLEKRPTIIANINKKKELMNGTGEKGYILIPEDLDINIKNNLDYYLSKLDLIEIKDIKKIPKRKE